MKADPINIALVFLVFMNTLAVVQFQALARSSLSGTFKVSTIEVAPRHTVGSIRNQE